MGLNLKDIGCDLIALKSELEFINKVIRDQNNIQIDKYNKLKDQHIQNSFTYGGVLIDLETLNKQGCLTVSNYLNLVKEFKSSWKNTDVICGTLKDLIVFDKENLITMPEDWKGEESIKKLLVNYVVLEKQFKKLSNKTINSHG